MAFDFYFAGGVDKDVEALIIQEGANMLRSYMNDKKSIEEFIKAKHNGWTGKLLIDNGAFTVHRKGGVLNIDEYIDYINSHPEADYFIALDDIPGKWGRPKTAEEVAESPIKTWENYLYMIDRVDNPEKLLPVFHQGEHFKYLDQYLTHPTPVYMCLSGNKELTNKQREEWYEKCYTHIRALKPTMKVHCLGSATFSNAEKFPFTSMDSTTWIMVAINGNILSDYGNVYVGDGGKSLSDPEKEAIQKYLDQFGYRLENMGDDRRARLIVNYRYIFGKSKTVETKGLKTQKRSLF